MPAIHIKAFQGLKPILEPLLLQQSEAVTATNVRLVSGALEPLKNWTTLKVLTKTAPQTIWRYGNDSAEANWWLEFLADTDVMRSPIAADPYGRVYWADGGVPKYGPNSLVISGSSYPGGSYDLGLPAPAAAPVISSFAAPPNAASSEVRVYVYTYVSAYGEEGPPSAASAPATMDPAGPVTVSGMSVAPVGAYNVATKRLYRSSTVGSAAQFQFVAEIPVATTSYVDSISQAALGEVLPSADWVAPPVGLRGLKALPNGAAIGFKGNTAYLSEPNLPHAWPNEYPIEEPIVGIGVFRQSAVLLTNGRPYLMSGADPAAMSVERMELPQACVSKRSIVDTGDGVLYASPDGLVSISSAGIDIITKSLMSREQWLAYNPSSMVAAVHDNKYHVAYQTTGGVRGMLTFDFSGQGAVMTSNQVNTATAVTAMYSDPRTDTLYLARGAEIVRFNAGTAMTYTWRSKKFRAPFHLNFSKGQVIADGPVTLRLIADGVQRMQKVASGSGIFQLPSGFRGLDWEIELAGESKVTQVSIATSAQEIREA